MRILFFTLVTLSLSEFSYADAFEWRITVTCDADAREARVEMYRCDANITDPNDTNGCQKQKAIISSNIRSATVDSEANRFLYTPVRSKSDFVSLMSNHPAEFSCRMPYGETKQPKDNAEESDDIFLRLERYPTTFNWGGQCGASPYSAMLSVQTGTANLDMSKPMKKIEMVGRCGWGDPDPISKVIINADSGKISTTPYSRK